MTVIYKLIKIQENQPESVVELSENQLEFIYSALGEYQDMVYDSESELYDEQDQSDYSDLQYKIGTV